MSQKMVLVKIEKIYDDVVVPQYAKEGDSGMDVRAYITEERANLEQDNYHGHGTLPPKTIPIFSHDRKIIPTGIKVSIPQGYEIQVRPRSGMAFKEGITVLNTPGTIDSGYRGEIGVILYNTTDRVIWIEHGYRIAQLVLQEVPQIVWEEVKSVDETSRGAGGFGSTGTA